MTELKVSLQEDWRFFESKLSHSHTRLLERIAHVPFFYWGLLLLCLGLAAYFIGIILLFGRWLLLRGPAQNDLSIAILLFSGIATLLGLVAIVVDLALILPRKRHKHRRPYDEHVSADLITVVLTAYNDEDSIAPAVAEFKAQPFVHRVIVVSNNSCDRTFERAVQAGAVSVNEPKPGYGRCVYRCLQEALAYQDAELILLCEGDMTFRASDIPKFLAYLPHADIVSGTRIVEQLREYSTQLSTFMYYGNFFVGKLLEVKHLGKGTFTDVGTTYKLIRRSSLQRVLPLLNPAINLSFNAHFLDVALSAGENLVECPVTFHARVGQSKGGNVNNRRALAVGLAMIKGLSFGWRA